MKKFFLYSIFGILIFLIWLHFVNPKEVFSNLKRMELSPVLFAVLSLLSAFIFRALRLKIVFDEFQRVSFKKIFKIFMSSALMGYFGFNYLGFVAEFLLYKKFEDIPYNRSISGIVSTRICEFILIFIILFLLVLSGIKLPLFASYTLITGCITFFAFLLLLLLFSEKGESFKNFLKRVLFFLPLKFKDRILNFILKFSEELRTIKNMKILILKIFFLSFLIIIFESYFVVYFVKALSIDVPITYALLSQGILTILFLVPSPPGQLGTAEAYITLIFTGMLGYKKGIIASAAILGHILSGCIIIIVGSASLASLGISLIEILKGIREDA